MISAAARSSTPIPTESPKSPRLVPLGSPGPVTPLQLESEDGGYLAVRTSTAPCGVVQPQELLERLVKEEAASQRRNDTRQPSR